MTSVRSLVLLALLALVVLLATPAAAAAAHEAEAATAQLVQTARGSIERLKARIQHPTASQQELVEQVDEEALLLESQAEAEATWCNAQGRQGPTTRQRPKRKLHLHDHMLTRVSFLSCVRVVNTLEWVEDDPPEVQALAEYIRLQLVPAAQGVVNENGRRDRSVSPPRADDRSVRQRQASPVRGAQMIPAFGFVDISSSATALAYPVPPITNLKNAHGLGAGFPSVIISGFTYTFDAGAGNHNRVRRVSGPVTTGGKTNPATAATEYCDALLQPVMPAVGAPYANTDLIRNRAKWETGHMIAASLGGSNTEPINFYPQHRVSNHQGARWGDAEMLALALKTLCLGQAAGMRVTVTVDFRYPVAAAAVAGAASVPGVNPRIPSEGDYTISVPTGANSCGNKLHLWCSPPAPGAPAGGLGVGACGAVPLLAGVNTLPAGVRQAFRARWPLLRAFYRRAVVAGNTATWSTPFRNDATDTRAGAAPGGPFDP